MRICEICKRTDENEKEDDALLYGDWMTKQYVTVHYYCLLLSTNLPQRGGDSSGILGFLLRDIRQEATAAQKRKCCYCDEKGASIFCRKCRKVFHLACGLEGRCVSHFTDEFSSYCDSCVPHDDYQRHLLANPPKNVRCDICFRPIIKFMLSLVTYGDCCRQGFAHRTCMRQYAIASGYYLRCLWCRGKSFRDTIKLQSVFVPDRDATWERQKNAYSELHSKRMRCDQTECLCPKGRNYNRGTWTIQLCTLCAATGTHLKCLVGAMRLPRTAPEFKCVFCTEVVLKLQGNQKSSNKSSWKTTDECIDASFYLHKKPCDLSMPMDVDSPTQSDEDNASSSNESSIVTVVASQEFKRQKQLPTPTRKEEEQPVEDVNVVDSVIELPDSQPLDITTTLKPPLLLCKSFTAGGFFFLVVFEYQDQEPKPAIGTCTLRFAIDDPRIKDRSEETLLQLSVTEADVWIRDSNRGIYDKIDQYTPNF
ncbi:hypothetical protein ACLKA6_007028 [Drosophila palustris]